MTNSKRVSPIIYRANIIQNLESMKRLGSSKKVVAERWSYVENITGLGAPRDNKNVSTSISFQLLAVDVNNDGETSFASANK